MSLSFLILRVDTRIGSLLVRVYFCWNSKCLNLVRLRMGAMMAISRDLGKGLGVLLLGGVLGAQMVCDRAWAGGGDTTGVVAAPVPTTVENSVLPSSSNAAALSVSPVAVQQNGVNNFASLGTATVPNCGGLCVYTNVRSVSANGGGNVGASQTEFSVGLMWQISSPEQSNIETQRRLADSQVNKVDDDQKDLWMKKLVEALNSKDLHGARGWAILLAPKLGRTPDQLLEQMRR